MEFVAQLKELSFTHNRLPYTVKHAIYMQMV